VTTFGSKNDENIAVQSFQILYIFVLRVKITAFEPKVVKTSARKTKILQN